MNLIEGSCPIVPPTARHCSILANIQYEVFLFDKIQAGSTDLIDTEAWEMMLLGAAIRVSG